MKGRCRLLFVSGAAGLMAVFASAQTPTATPAAVPSPTPAAVPSSPSPSPVPTSGFAPSRLAHTPVVTTLKLPAENPFGTNVEAAAALPAKPVFSEFVVPTALFGTMRVDRSGKVIQSKRARDPIPSLAADTKKSFDRWVFEPARRSGQPVETWASVRVDLSVEVRPPKIEQIALTPVTPTTAIPAPFDWGSDAAWYDNLKAAPPSDGTVAVEQVDSPPVPKKTPWYADSFKGPFSCRLWVKANAAGRIEKIFPIQVSDPILIAYLRHELPTWPLRPARVQGKPADSWNELVMSGTIGYSIEVKQIFNLRKTIAGG